MVWPLAETTPGPLVLVLSFVGFMAAFRAPLGLDPLWTGAAGRDACDLGHVHSLFPVDFSRCALCRDLRNNRALSGALAAISAAVTGVILNLALWFGLHVLFAEVNRHAAGPLSMPLPAWQTFQPAAFLLTLLAALVLFG